MPHPPLLNANDTILWLKAALTSAMLVWLYYRCRPEHPHAYDSWRTRLPILLGVIFAFGVFHNLGEFAGGSFVHHAEMFHYYLGPKYFQELGYYELYNAVVVADAEQGHQLAHLPFYTDLKTYQNTIREVALRDADTIRGLFSASRWTEFKADVAFFKRAFDLPRSTKFFFVLTDHGYNGSPLSTLMLGWLTNAVPVTQLAALAVLDVLLVIVMGLLVFHAFGFEMGALFATYFSVNALNAHDFVSGSLLRYDWLVYLVLGLCLLEKKRHAWSAFFITLAAMIRVFPAVLFAGVAVTLGQGIWTQRRVDRNTVYFTTAAVAAAGLLFVLPAVSLGSVLQPWNDFLANTWLHNAGVYVNHLGLRSIVLFEPSHLDLEDFVRTFSSSQTNDLVRHWQDIKEAEFKQKSWLVTLASCLTLGGVAAIIWKRNTRRGRVELDGEALLWPLLVIYTMSFLAHYYYVFLCLFVLLFFKRSNPRRAFVPLAVLLTLNLAILLTDSRRPSPIVFYTLANLYLFASFAALLLLELRASRELAPPRTPSTSPPAGLSSLAEPGRARPRPQRKQRSRGRRK